MIRPSTHQIKPRTAAKQRDAAQRTKPPTAAQGQASPARAPVKRSAKTAASSSLRSEPEPLVGTGGDRPDTGPQHRRSWLPRLNPLLAPRFHALLPPAGAIDNADSAERCVRAILEDACAGRATDVHLEPFSAGWRVRFRVDGQLHDVAQVGSDLGQRMVRYLRTAASLDPVIGHLPQDASLQFTLLDHTVDLRLATAPCSGTEKLALRLLDPSSMEHRISELGLGSQSLRVLETWLKEVSGLFLVTGPTGSGKTTTLYALVREFELSSHSILTIEDPIECPIDGISQLQVNEAAGLTFAAALKSMLRLDPDYLLVGEMRDSESARIALEATATGHCVLSTLHSPDTAGIVTLLRNWGIHDHYVANTLRIVINQCLVRRLCQECRQASSPTKPQRAWFRRLNLRPPTRAWQPAGCPACQQTGYHGRIGLFEVWQKDASDYALLLSHVDEQTLRGHLRQRGIHTLLQDGLTKARNGVTSLEELQTLAGHPGT
jgi:general secretion pathway protein E